MEYVNTIEGWAKILHTPKWLFEAAKALRQWPEGAEVAEHDYLDATAEASEIPLGYKADR